MFHFSFRLSFSCPSPSPFLSFCLRFLIPPLPCAPTASTCRALPFVPEVPRHPHIPLRRTQGPGKRGAKNENKKWESEKKKIHHEGVGKILAAARSTGSASQTDSDGAREKMGHIQQTKGKRLMDFRHSLFLQVAQKRGFPHAVWLTRHAVLVGDEHTSPNGMADEIEGWRGIAMDTTSPRCGDGPGAKCPEQGPRSKRWHFGQRKELSRGRLFLR